MTRPIRSDDRGETLVELLVALTILGIAGVAIVAGLQMSVRSSDQGRRSATGGAYVRSFAEAIQTSIDNNAGYATTCGVAGATARAKYAAVAVTLPATYSKSVDAVESWDGSAWRACDATGIQRVKLTVTNGSGTRAVSERLTVVLRKACNGDAETLGADPCAG
jgi:prepilin-type N-terminal cleavage/methylation domain-containing protein